MSAIGRRVRRLEDRQRPASRRVIVVAVPYPMDAVAVDAILKREGISTTPADLVIRLHSFLPSGGLAIPRLVHVAPAV